MAMHPLFDSYSDLESRWSQAIIRRGYTVLPNTLIQLVGVLNISPNEFLVLSVILSYRWTTDQAWPSLKTISIHSGLSERTVMRATKSLVKKEYIEKERRYSRSNKYSINGLIDQLHELAKVMP